MDNFIILAIIFPLISGLIVYKANNKYLPVVIFSIAEFLLVILTVIYSESLHLGSFTSYLSVDFYLDNIAKIYVVIISIVWLCVGLFSVQYMKKETDQGRYYFFHFLVWGVLIALSLSANYFTMYMFYEIMTFSSFPLVIHDKTKAAIAAGNKYLGYSVLGAGLGLIGLFFLSYYGNTSFVYGGSYISGSHDLMLFIYLILMLGFSVKSGMFPLHAWLPTAHPEAPSPASAILSGCITKMGILAMIRITYFIYGTNYLANSYPIIIITVLSLITIFMGSMLAYNCKLSKKRLAFSTISQVSYIIFALMSLNIYGLVAAILHTVYHMFSKNILFLVSGTVIQATGNKEMSAYDGLAKKMPYTMACYTVASLALVGLPITGGFVSKWFIAEAVLKSASLLNIIGVIVLLISAILTAGYLIVPCVNAYFKDNGHENLSPSIYEKLALITLAVLVIALAIYPNPISDLIFNLV